MDKRFFQKVPESSPLGNMTSRILRSNNSPMYNRIPESSSPLKRQMIDMSSSVEAVSCQKLITTIPKKVKKLDLDRNKVDQSILISSSRCNPETPKTKLDEARLLCHVSAIPESPSAGVAVPGSLVCRENEFRSIYNYLKERIIRGKHGYLYISGIPGSGKTATVHRVIKKLRNDFKTRRNKFKYIEINGLYMEEPTKVYCKILEQYSEDVAPAKQAQRQLNKIFGCKGPMQLPVILFVDELDCIYNKNPDVIFNILQWHQKSHSQMTVLTIANNDDLISALKENFKGDINITNLNFDVYTNQDLQKIVTNRLQGKNIFEPSAVEYLIKKCVSNNGDARAALDICRKVLDLITEQNNSISAITLQNVKQACEKIAVDPFILAIKCSSNIEQILLRVIRDETSNAGSEYSLSERLYFRFRAICTLEGVRCPSISDVCVICHKLNDMGLLSLDSDAMKIHTKVKLNVDPHLINTALHFNNT